jgi:hypothetical protein
MHRTWCGHLGGMKTAYLVRYTDQIKFNNTKIGQYASTWIIRRKIQGRIAGDVSRQNGLKRGLEQVKQYWMNILQVSIGWIILGCSLVSHKATIQ